MSEFSWLRLCKDDELRDRARKSCFPAFHSVPKSKRWATTVFVAGGCFSGLAVLYEALERLHWIYGVLLLWAILGAWALFFVLEAETHHRNLRDAIESEMARRGLEK